MIIMTWKFVLHYLQLKNYKNGPYVIVWKNYISLARSSYLLLIRFDEIITRPLIEDALDRFNKYSVREEDVDVVWVPGCFETGLVAEKLGKSGKYNATVCIGAVVKGGIVANPAASLRCPTYLEF